PPRPTPFPYTTLFRSRAAGARLGSHPLRHLSTLLRYGFRRAVARADDAALLPPLRRLGRPVRKHGRRLARAGHERRHRHLVTRRDRKSTRLNSSHVKI